MRVENVDVNGRYGWWLILLCIGIHVSFYASALLTSHLQVFYPQGTIQDQPELDYSQVPNGARTRFEGGSWLGRPRPYPVLPNVYHPATTLIIGGPLQLFDQPTGFVVFTLVKLPLTAVMFALLWSIGRTCDSFVPAACVFFAFFAQGIDISCGQYHFLLNLFVFLFLYSELRGRSERWQAVWLSGSLLIKPIALLWLPTLVEKRRYVTVSIAFGIFLALTIGFYFDFAHDGNFYAENLLTRSTSAAESSVAPYTLTSAFRYLGATEAATEIVKYASGAGLMLLTFWARPSVFSGTLLWTCYYLFFYSYVFEYHYTTLMPFFTLGLLTQAAFRPRVVRWCVLMSCLPSPYFLFRLLNLFPGSGPRTVSSDGQFLMTCFKLVPILIVAGYVVWYETGRWSKPAASADRIHEKPDHSEGQRREGF